MKKLNLKVQGMTCSSCEVLIERKLKHLPGVEKVKVSRAKEEVQVECDDTVTVAQLQEPIKEKYTLSSQDFIENHPESKFKNGAQSDKMKRESGQNRAFQFGCFLYHRCRQRNHLV